MIKPFLITSVLAILAATVVWPNHVSADEPSMDWKAQWIWQAEDGPANSWVAFRKTVDVATVPKKVIANISADSKYWMWINGDHRQQADVSLASLPGHSGFAAPRNLQPSS